MKSKLSVIIFLVLTLICLNGRAQDPLSDPLNAGWKGEAVCELLEENEKLRVLQCTFAPGIGHEKHFHSAHFAYAISGSRFRLEDKNGVREVDFPTGSNYYSAGVEWHTALNIGDSTAVVLIIEPK